MTSKRNAGVNVNVNLNAKFDLLYILTRSPTPWHDPRKCQCNECKILHLLDWL